MEQSLPSSWITIASFDQLIIILVEIGPKKIIFHQIVFFLIFLINLHKI